jgi:hypothetical protein
MLFIAFSIFSSTDYCMLTTGYFTNEPKPPPMHGLDVAWLTRIISQCAPQFLNARRQRIIPYHGVRPYGLKKFIFCHHFS